MRKLARWLGNPCYIAEVMHRDNRHILSDACALFGRKAVADAMNVTEVVVGGWLTGEGTIPDGQLLRLADALVKLAGPKTTQG